MGRSSYGFSTFVRSFLTVAVAVFVFTGFVAPAQAAPAAEQFINENIQKGIAILDNKALSRDQRRDQFKDVLVSIIDIRRVADYTLGQYRRGASPADIAAYEATYREYALTVYQVYFNKFCGLTMQVGGSYALSGDESVVKTVMLDPARKTLKKPLTVNFRVSGAGGKFFITDISVEGVWLRQTQRDDFTAYLGQNGGNIQALIGVLKEKTKDTLAHSK